MIAVPRLTPPHGEHAARDVAQLLAADGEHSHLANEAESVCVSGVCEPTGVYR